MAGRPLRAGQHQQGVVVAVGFDAKPARGNGRTVSPLVHSRCATAAVERDTAAGQRRLPMPRDPCSPASARAAWSASCTMAGSRPSCLSQAQGGDLLRLASRTSMPAARSDRFSSGSRMRREWKTLAANAPSTSAQRNTCGEMFDRARTAGRDQRHLGRHRAPRCSCTRSIATANAIAAHAVEHDLAGAALLRLHHPVQRPRRQCAGPRRIAGVLAHAPFAVVVAQAVDANDHALHAEGLGQFPDQFGALERRRVDRHLVRTRMQHAPAHPRRCGCHRRRRTGYRVARATRSTQAAVGAAAFGTGGDVVEHQLVGAFVAIAQRQFDDSRPCPRGRGSARP